MIRLPGDLSTVGEVRLRALEAGTWRELQRLVRRLRVSVPEFDLALKNSFAVEDEILRRGDDGGAEEPDLR